MQRIRAVVVVTLLCSPLLSFGEDKKEPRSLAAEAAYLTQKSGENGWASEVVTMSMNDGKVKARGKLLIHFTADKDKPTGNLRLAIDHGTSKVSSLPLRFELVEKDGKRSIKILSASSKPDPKDATDPKVVATLEYSVKADELTVTGGVVRRSWAGWDVDLTKATSFKAAEK